MSNPTVIAITTLVLAVVLSAVLVRARGIGPMVSLGLGLVLGLAAGISATLLATGGLA